MVHPCNNWPVDGGALWLREYMVWVDRSLYVSLAERRCNREHIVRHREYAAPEEENVHVRLPEALSELHVFP